MLSQKAKALKHYMEYTALLREPPAPEHKPPPPCPATVGSQEENKMAAGTPPHIWNLREEFGTPDIC